MNRSIDEIIEIGGGARALAVASERTKWPVGFDAVYKWPKIGIPERHWPLLIGRVEKLTPAELYAANQPARNGKSGKSPKRPRKRVRSRRALGLLPAVAA